MCKLKKKKQQTKKRVDIKKAENLHQHSEVVFKLIFL